MAESVALVWLGGMGGGGGGEEAAGGADGAAAPAAAAAAERQALPRRLIPDTEYQVAAGLGCLLLPASRRLPCPALPCEGTKAPPTRSSARRRRPRPPRAPARPPPQPAVAEHVHLVTLAADLQAHHFRALGCVYNPDDLRERPALRGALPLSLCVASLRCRLLCLPGVHTRGAGPRPQRRPRSFTRLPALPSLAHPPTHTPPAGPQRQTRSWGWRTASPPACTATSPGSRRRAGWAGAQPALPLQQGL